MTNELQCPCGFTAKTKAGLSAHMRSCKSKPATPVASIEQSDIKGDIMDVLQTMSATLNGISDRVVKLENDKLPITATEQTAEVIGDTPEPIQDETLEEKKIAPRHRAIVTEVLGEQFDAWETYGDTASTQFMIHIEIPLEFSSMTQKDRDLGRAHDIRSRAVTLSAGEQGVREWCILVRKNLDKFYAAKGIRSPFTSANY